MCDRGGSLQTTRARVPGEAGAAGEVNRCSWKRFGWASKAKLHCGPARPTAIRLHRRAQRFAPAEPPIPPLIVPEAPPEKAAPTPTPRAAPAPTPEEAVGPKARQALRGVVGCANPNAVGLTAEERRLAAPLPQPGGRPTKRYRRRMEGWL